MLIPSDHVVDPQKQPTTNATASQPESAAQSASLIPVQPPATMSAAATQPPGVTATSTQQLIPTSTPQPGTAARNPVLDQVDSRETVAGQLDRILGADSPLLQGARTRAMEFATARGLQNSSIAGQAGEQSVINTALPIAQQDASSAASRAQSYIDQGNRERTIGVETEARRSLIGTETEARARLLTQEGQQRLAEIGAQTDANMRLQQMDQDFRLLLEDRAAGHTLTLEDRRFQNQMASLVAEYGHRTTLSQTEQLQQLERMNLQHAQTLEQITAQAQATQQTEIGPRLGSQYLAAISERMNAASREIQEIYTTQGLSASQQQSAVANAYNRLQTDLTAIGGYYQQSPFWDSRWSTGQPGASGPTMGAPGSPMPPGSANPDPAPPRTLPPNWYLR